jgi:hypothetical protein
MVKRRAERAETERDALAGRLKAREMPEGKDAERQTLDGSTTPRRLHLAQA